MEISDIQRGLEGFTEKLSSQTYFGTYRAQTRDSFLSDSTKVGTRANSIWKMAEYIIAYYGTTDEPMKRYLEGWSTLVKQYKNQYLIIALDNQGNWGMYDSDSNFMGGNDFIIDYLASKTKYKDKDLGSTIIKTLPTSLTATSISSFNQQLLSAIRTKPLVLLAGISGTGKSRIVRELAKACWPAGNENRTGHKPMNYKMIQVRPNWHDSSEILGYVSRIDGEEFVVGPFLQAIVEAWKDTERPYFVCLDEMNLAPVEQYFAEYLSVFESREFDGEHYVTDPIMEKQVEQWYIDMVQKLVPDDEVLRNQFLTQGISIPENLVVIGTVNMDETTYSFSRKVLDRAMTLEMNDVTLEAGINGNPLENDFSDVLISAGDVFGRPKKMAEILAGNVGVSESVVSYLKKINEILAETPFRIAFRTRNEAILYVLNKLELMSSLDGYDESVELSNALDEITMMKILSRIEGDQSKVSADKLNNLKANVGSKSKAKLDYMIKKLNNVGFTSFWE